MSRYHVGQRVTVANGQFAGCRGRITQQAHADVRPYLDWVVTFESGPTEGREWAGFAERELGPWTVPEDARPVSVGALKRGGR